MSVIDALDSPDMLTIGLGATGRATLSAARATGTNAVGINRGNARDGAPLEGSHYGMRAWGIFPDGTVVLASGDGSYRCKPRAIVVATGSLDLPLALPGWELPGVDGAHRASEHLAAGSRVVVIRGPHAAIGNRQPDLASFDITADYTLAEGTPVTISGDGRVERVSIGDDAIETEHLLLDNGIQPENTLARMTGLPTMFSMPAGGDVIVPGAVIAAESTLLSVVGDAAGIHTDRAHSVREAEATGRILAESLLTGRIPVSAIHERRRWPSAGPPVLPDQATDDTLVCPDEDITVGMVREAIAHGAVSVNDVKRRTRAAMARCQGRDCLWTIRALLAEAGRDWKTPMTARPPAVGITLDELAAIAAD